jgi:hypothetical protein
MKNLLACTLALLAAWPALAQGDDPAQRARLREERAAADARFAQDKMACRAKFAVTDCIAKVTRERNARVADLRRQERVLDDAERQRRAAARQQELDERNSPQRQQEAADKRAKAQADQQNRDARAADKAGRRAGQEAPQGTPRTSSAPRSNAPTPQEAAKSRADYEARKKEAEQHKAEVADRNAKRTKPPAADLPPPQ